MSIEKQHREMVAALVKPPAEILRGMTEQYAAAIHAALGIAGEVGELEDLANRDHCVEEYGDLLFYCSDLRQTLDLVPYDPEWSKYSYQPVAGSPRGSACYIAGQIVDIVKKAVVYGQGFDQTKKVRIINHLDQLEYVISINLACVVSNREECLKRNMEKLSTGPNARYANGYSDEAAAARADKAEEPPVAPEHFRTPEIEELSESTKAIYAKFARLVEGVSVRWSSPDAENKETAVLLKDAKTTGGESVHPGMDVFLITDRGIWAATLQEIEIVEPS